MPAKRDTKRGMSAEHKASLAQGRTEGRTVRLYLEGLRATAPRRGRRRTAESVERQLAKIDDEIATADPVRQLKLVQARRDLQTELESMGHVGRHGGAGVGVRRDRQVLQRPPGHQLPVVARGRRAGRRAGAGRDQPQPIGGRRVRSPTDRVEVLEQAAEQPVAAGRVVEQPTGGVEPVLAAAGVGDPEVDDVRAAVGQRPADGPVDAVPVVLEDGGEEVAVGHRWTDREPEHVEQLGGPGHGVGVGVPEPRAHGRPLRRLRREVVDADGAHAGPVLGQGHAPARPPVPAVPGQHAHLERDERRPHAGRPQVVAGLGQQLAVVGVDELQVRGALQIGRRPPEQVAGRRRGDWNVAWTLVDHGGPPLPQQAGRPGCPGSWRAAPRAPSGPAASRSVVMAVLPQRRRHQSPPAARPKHPHGTPPGAGAGTESFWRSRDQSGGRRRRLVSPRRFLASTRRRWADFDGRVGRRGGGGGSMAPATRPASRSIAASRLRSCERRSDAVTVIVPSTSEPARRRRARSRWASVSAAERSRSQRQLDARVGGVDVLPAGAGRAGEPPRQLGRRDGDGRPDAHVVHHPLVSVSLTSSRP